MSFSFLKMLLKLSVSVAHLLYFLCNLLCETTSAMKIGIDLNLIMSNISMDNNIEDSGLGTVNPLSIDEFNTTMTV